MKSIYSRGYCRSDDYSSDYVYKSVLVLSLTLTHICETTALQRDTNQVLADIDTFHSSTTYYDLFFINDSINK